MKSKMGKRHKKPAAKIPYAVLLLAGLGAAVASILLGAGIMFVFYVITILTKQ